MFVGLLKFSKASLEGAWDQDFPRQGTVEICPFRIRPHPFSCKMEVEIVGLSLGLVRGSRFMTKVLQIRYVGKTIACFTEGR